MEITDELIEKCAKSVHKAYCACYLKKHGKEYWTKGNYNLLDEPTKEIDRKAVKAVFSELGFTNTMENNITQDFLKGKGWNKIEWNGGVIIGYYWPLDKGHDSETYRDADIEVRFGEYKNEDFRVWLCVPSKMIYFKGIKTYEQIKKLYFLLKNEQLPNK